MSTTMKIVLLGGLVIASVGYLLPTTLAIYAVFFTSFLLGGAAYMSVVNQKNISTAKSILPFLIVLLLSLWASLILFAICHIPNLPQCSIGRIRAVVFVGFTSPMLIALAIWLQILFRKGQ